MRSGPRTMVHPRNSSHHQQSRDIQICLTQTWRWTMGPKASCALLPRSSNTTPELKLSKQRSTRKFNKRSVNKLWPRRLNFAPQRSKATNSPPNIMTNLQPPLPSQEYLERSKETCQPQKLHQTASTLTLSSSPVVIPPCLPP